jgi:hypothetical protein
MNTEITELLERFQRGPELVAAAITGLEDAERDHREDPARWNIREIVAHLADAEIVAAERVRFVIAEDNATLIAFNQDAWVARLGCATRDLFQSLDLFRILRAENYRLLKDLPEEAYERKGNHTERGPITLLDLLKLFAAHPEKHARQILAVREHYKQNRKAAKA